MPLEAPIPPDVVKFSFTAHAGANRSSFGWWMLWPGLTPADPAWAELVVTSFYTNLLTYFTAVMHSAATIRTCRLLVGGTPPFSFVADLAPNAGALTAGQMPAIAAGVYIQTSGGGRGSGSRIRVPHIGNEMTDDFAYLSDYGQQQLQFLATAMAAWPAQLALLGRGTPVYGTLQRKDSGAFIHPATFDPASGIRTTLRLDVLSRRQRSSSGLSPT